MVGLQSGAGGKPGKHEVTQSSVDSVRELRADGLEEGVRESLEV